jgi:hypothetical protein
LRSAAAYRNFPGGAGDEDLEHIGWDEWFETFDEQAPAAVIQERRPTARTARSSSS